MMPTAEHKLSKWDTESMCDDRLLIITYGPIRSCEKLNNMSYYGELLMCSMSVILEFISQLVIQMMLIKAASVVSVVPHNRLLRFLSVLHKDYDIVIISAKSIENPEQAARSFPCSSAGST